jgi:hypothetical protein
MTLTTETSGSRFFLVVGEKPEGAEAPSGDGPRGEDGLAVKEALARD